jgi:hypothetical protein
MKIQNQVLCFFTITAGLIFFACENSADPDWSKPQYACFYSELDYCVLVLDSALSGSNKDSLKNSCESSTTKDSLIGLFGKECPRSMITDSCTVSQNPKTLFFLYDTTLTLCPDPQESSSSSEILPSSSL